MGGNETQEVVIELNGKSLKIESTYMLSAKNSAATVTIKNGTVKGITTFSNTYNIADIQLADCNWVLENIDISAVLADSFNAVWVDNESQDDQGNNAGGAGNASYSDYIILVTVDGGTLTFEP